ncbi:serine/threonine-protein kinase [Pseudolysinimonas sp.]|uniref:serine/threonine-protein kinase n=1 Tax=Pseudolysinimonas sp. TaxID=2680009 RepID=UPI00286BAC01|nr:serine/threonine-protein kinase [Pseudolysinimonas sp.]
MQVPDVGQTFHGRYALRERLGDGGTASVFRADDLQLRRSVAIKVYGAESEVSDSARRQREARALAGLRHPAIVTLFDARLDATPPYLVLEFVDGETLAARIARGPLSAVETRLVGAAAASGLAAAHDAGVVHRDIKPANIMIPAVPDPEEARLLDFGIAHSVGGSRATTAGSVVGSAVYLSPEQARGGDVTPASDVYSLGLVLIECLTGRPAFSGTAEEVLGARLVRSPALDDPALAADAPLLARMTALDAADRPRAVEVARELDVPAATRVLAAAPSDAPTERMAGAAPPPPVRPPRERRRASPRLLFGGLVTLLAGALVLAAVFVGIPALMASLTPGDSPPAEVDVTPRPTPTPTPTPTPETDDDAPGNSGNNGNNNGNGKDKKP